MNNCAFSYLEMCREGNTSVWSVSKKNGEILKPILTIELQGSVVTQIVRKNNNKPSKSDFEMVKSWAEERALEILLSNPFFEID